MKKFIIILILCTITISCSKKYIVYSKGKTFITNKYNYEQGLPEFGINGVDVDSVRLIGDTTHIEYKYK